MALPVVVIVGRPNVGKSTMFNRIIRSNVAVVDPTPGITRDRNYAEAEWNGLSFTLVDTGGWLPIGGGDELADAVTEQTLIAAREADFIIFTVDGLSGLTEHDRQLAKIIHKQNTPVLFVINKVDDVSQIGLAYESAALGLGEPSPCSARTGYMFAEMLDDLARQLKELNLERSAKNNVDELSIAIIGAPNAGKSSLVNRLSGDERMVVSDIPGTTRDAIDTIIKYHGKSIRLIDTAGLKRKRFGQRGLEFYMSLRALRSLDRCDVAVIMIDATLGLTQGDMKLINEAEDRGVGIVLAVNKWDAVEKDAKTADEWLENWRFRMPNYGWVPVMFISALTGQRSIKIIANAMEVAEQRRMRVKTSDFNDKVVAILQRKPPSAVKGKLVRIKYGNQVAVNPPYFVFSASHAGLISRQYKRFVERIIRENYGFRGTPVRLGFKGK